MSLRQAEFGSQAIHNLEERLRLRTFGVCYDSWFSRVGVCTYPRMKRNVTK